ncbi:MAG: prephenate dehydratase [Armatimonadota bacterium]|nr:MAG: prephenate dehydratase [Armatimonadota bacterium]
MDIDAIRRHIDEMDDQILELLNRRAKQAVEIGRLKQDAGGAIFDPAREKQILDRLTSINRGPLSAEAVIEIFGAIFAAHRLLEKRLVVAYYGPAGSFTHIAASTKFGARADLRPMDTISDVFRAVEKRDADFGVVPIENTTAGVVPLTLDAFAESNLSICAELHVDIEHCLLSRCTSLDQVALVYSHPHALAQCRIWLRSNLPRAELIPVGSTARAAELASAKKEGASSADAAAIGPALAGELYSLPVLRAKIHDMPENRTRFVTVGGVQPAPTGNDRTSLVFCVEHKAGALHRALGVLTDHSINMTFIQSHPIKQTPWEYMFFVDVVGHADDPELSQALTELRDRTTLLRVLGSYPEAPERSASP